MNTTELIDRLAKRLQVNKAEAKRLLNAHLDALGRHLASGDSVVLRGFGTFSVRRTRSHNGYLPNTKVKAHFPGHQRPHFRPSNRLKAEIENPGDAGKI